MTSTTERLEGSGSLEPASGGEAKPVKFSFVIRQTIVTRPGPPPAPGRAEGRGKVSATDGTYLPDGFYRLTLPDGRQIRVQNLGGEWHILAPLVG
jgi:hypothetical protein